VNNPTKGREQHITSFVKLLIRAGVVIMACLIGATARAQLIDDFSSAATTNNYNRTIILAQNADGPMDLSITNGAIQVWRTYSSGNTPQQDVFLRGDYSLGVGQTLRVDTLNVLGTNWSYNSDFGITVAAQTNPLAAVYQGANVDVRSNEISMYIKPGSAEVGLAAFDGHVQLYSVHNTIPTGYTNITGLWITRTSAHVFDVGYTTTTDITYRAGLTFTNGSLGDDLVGSALGLYADVRATGYSPAWLDNLRIIPEPSTVALIGMGLGCGAMLLRRKRL
jgi:hypothetical protein